MRVENDKAEEADGVGWVLDWSTQEKLREEDVRVAMANESTFNYLLSELNTKPDPKPAAVGKRPAAGVAPRRRGMPTTRGGASSLLSPRGLLIAGAAAAAACAANLKGTEAVKRAPEAVRAWAGLLAPQACAVALVPALRAALPTLSPGLAAVVAVAVSAGAAGFATSQLPRGPVVVDADWPPPAFNCSGAQHVASHTWKLCCYF